MAEHRESPDDQWLVGERLGEVTFPQRDGSGNVLRVPVQDGVGGGRDGEEIEPQVAYVRFGVLSATCCTRHKQS